MRDYAQVSNFSSLWPSANMSEGYNADLDYLRTTIERVYSNCSHLIRPARLNEETGAVEELAVCARDRVVDKAAFLRAVEAVQKSNADPTSRRARIVAASQTCRPRIEAAMRNAQQASKHSEFMVQSISEVYECTTQQASDDELRNLWQRFTTCYEPQQQKSQDEHFRKYNDCRQNFLDFQKAWVGASTQGSLMTPEFSRSITREEELYDFDFLATLLMSAGAAKHE